jgi:hypothetical protein
MVIGKRKSLVALSFFAFSLVQAGAQSQDMDLRDAVHELLSNALQINISARVLPPDEKPVWNVESSKLTIPGRSVRIRLDGDNVRIYLICTPYVRENGTVLLLAQGQVWLSEPPDKEIKYFSTFYSIPVSFGEKVLFFPLGLSDKAAGNGGETAAAGASGTAAEEEQAEEGGGETPAGDEAVKTDEGTGEVQAQKEFFNIQMEIQIVPYKDKAKK